MIIGIGMLMTANLSGDLCSLFLNMWTFAPFLALMLIAGGAALMLWPESARRRYRPFDLRIHRPGPESHPARWCAYDVFDTRLWLNSRSKRCVFDGKALKPRKTLAS